ncbi:MAG TPA: AAA family ATPase [Candidatus Angelobacter sp.]|nr:AAA family ATPase [Candidatus Angelobacter sp.]
MSKFSSPISDAARDAQAQLIPAADPCVAITILKRSARILFALLALTAIMPTKLSFADARAAAYWHAEEGRCPLPIPHKTKGPVTEQWQTLQITRENVPKYFNGGRQNIGVKLGQPYNLTDVDLDAPEATQAWAEFGPETGFAFGHKSKPASHFFYHVDPGIKLRQYQDPTARKGGAGGGEADKQGMLLEVRCRKKDGGIGLQTVVPPSVHPSGELIEFVRGSTGLIGNVDGRELVRAADYTAACVLLGKYAPPPQGGRHSYFLSVAGALAHKRWALADATRVVRAIYRVLWQDKADLGQAARDVESTFQRHDDGREITGLPHLKEVLDPRVFKAAVEWLGLRGGPERNAPEAAPPSADTEAPSKRPRPQSNKNRPDSVPASADVERWVLGAILAAHSGGDAIWDVLQLEDFSLAKHQTIYRRMRALRERGAPVDRITLATELTAHHELEKVDGFRYLAAMDDGLPDLPHPLHYVTILRELTLRRRSIHSAGVLMQSMADLAMPPDTLLAEFAERLDSMTVRRKQSLLERGNVWTYEGKLSWLVEGLVLDGCINMFTGEAGSGKSLFLLVLAACVAQGIEFAGMTTVKRPVVYLDREMPVGLVKDRLDKLDIKSMYPALRYLGGWEEDEVPGPTARELLSLAKNEHALFIFDPLIAFMQGDENDNSAVRAHIQQYRPLAHAGGSVILNHHKSDKSDAPYRGGSDHMGSIDFGWVLGRDGELLTDDIKRVTLRPLKTRSGGKQMLRFGFGEKTFYPLDEKPKEPIAVLKELIKAYPGRNQRELIKLAASMGVGKHAVEDALSTATLSRELEVETKGKAIRYYLPGSRPPLEGTV